MFCKMLEMEIIDMFLLIYKQIKRVILEISAMIITRFIKIRKEEKHSYSAINLIMKNV